MIDVPGMDKPFPGQSYGRQPGARSRQHDGRSLGAGKESWRAVEAGNQRAGFDDCAARCRTRWRFPRLRLLTAQDGTTSVMLAGSCAKSASASDQCAHQKTVKTGIREADRIQIVEGLASRRPCCWHWSLRTARQQPDRKRGSQAGRERVRIKDRRIRMKVQRSSAGGAG